MAVLKVIQQGLKKANLDSKIIQCVPTTDRRAVGELLQLKDFVDVIIPRGGKSLIERVSAESKIPVIKHLDGICHVYVDAEADIEKALAIAVNAKTHRYGVCNAMETLLVHKSVANKFLKPFAKAMKKHAVDIRGLSLIHI